MTFASLSAWSIISDKTPTVKLPGVPKDILALAARAKGEQGSDGTRELKSWKPLKKRQGFFSSQIGVTSDEG
eukprot:CAMPEP_0114539520 /NCGR_PEP_ID=MMETSP0114-20121206/279_1 /TAXON_ID=31324 /ORGANISM="Goniomonas sp, Strain m" /LENGTH=71 /DNA_ID=CAMNT_0001723623 /DNA_START=8 /DNA_END=223 /DNA_ORIENTATION=-